MSTVQRSSATRAPAPASAAEASLGAAALQTLATKIGAAAGDDKDFPDLTSGNRGVRGYELTGARAQLLLDLAGEGTKLKAGERVVGLLVTEDESFIKLAIVDDKTLGVRPAGELNFNNVPLETKSGDEIDPFHGYYLLLKGAPELPLAHGDSNSSWSIDAYKSDDGPKRLPALALPTPVQPSPPPPDFVDAAGAAYLASKIAQHAGGKLPALNAGARGTHVYEVPPADAAAISKALDNGGFSASDAKGYVFLAILQTGAKPELQGLKVSRSDIGKAQMGAAFLNTKALDGKQIATLLANAKELPVAGRVEGFSPQELAGARPTTAQVIGADKPALPPTSTQATDRSASPLATRLQAAGGTASLGAAALKKVAEQIGANAGDDKTFPDLTSGNRGVRGYEVAGSRGQALLDLAGDGATLKAGERVVGLLVTEDESWVKLAIVDDKTLAVRDAGEINFFNTPLETKDGDEVDAFHAYYLMFKGAPELPLAHGDEGSSWTIKAYKSDDGPARVAQLEGKPEKASTSTTAAPKPQPLTPITSDDATSAARKYESMSMGWGSKADAATLADFLARASTAPAVFVEFLAEAFSSDLRKTGSVWHPAHVAAEFSTNADMKKLKKDVAATLSGVSAAPAGISPFAVGKHLNGLSFGTGDTDGILLLAQQLPAVLQDPFAFAYAKHVAKIDADDSVADVKKSALGYAKLGQKDNEDADNAKAVAQLIAALR